MKSVVRVLSGRAPGHSVALNIDANRTPSISGSHWVSSSLRLARLRAIHLNLSDVVVLAGDSTQQSIRQPHEKGPQPGRRTFGPHRFSRLLKWPLILSWLATSLDSASPVRRQNIPAFYRVHNHGKYDFIQLRGIVWPFQQKMLVFNSTTHYLNLHCYLLPGAVGCRVFRSPCLRPGRFAMGTSRSAEAHILDRSARRVELE